MGLQDNSRQWYPFSLESVAKLKPWKKVVNLDDIHPLYGHMSVNAVRVQVFRRVRVPSVVCPRMILSVGSRVCPYRVIFTKDFPPNKNKVT